MAVVRLTTFYGVLSATDYFSGSGSGLSSNTVPRAAVANGTASHVVINDGGGALSSEAQLAMSRGGTGAALASTLDTNILRLAPSASAVSTILATAAATADSIVMRDASGNASFGGSQIPSGGVAASTSSPTASGIQAACGSVSTTAGVTAAILTIGTAAGYAGVVRCSIVVGDATASSHRGIFEAIWTWKRVGANPVEFTTTPSYKLVDVSGSYDLTCAVVGTDVVVRANQDAGLATTLYWTGKFDVTHTKLS